MNASPASSFSYDFVILAAGKGKRMNSRLPKVLHPVLFQPLLHHVLDLVHSISHRKIYVVVGHGEEMVRSSCASYPSTQFVSQKEQRGTGHAIQQLEPLIGKNSGSLFVLSGDVILLKKSTLEEMLDSHARTKAAITVLTTHFENPTGYGRILRQGEHIRGIREEADASPEEKRITEINAGIYLFDIQKLFLALREVSPKNNQNEIYLTDTIEILSAQKERVVPFSSRHAFETMGINDRLALSQVESLLQERINQEWMKQGVTLHQPQSILIDALSKFGTDVTIEPHSTILKSTVGDNVTIESGCRIEGCHIAEGAHLKQGSYLSSSTVGKQTVVGPYAHLRPGTTLGEEVKVGNFVEIKKSTLAAGVKASHLSYIGDAEIGENTNLGCGFITCNYDGKEKFKTIVGADVFVGSDSQTVAPVQIGEGSYIAAGSTITQDVPPHSLALSRGRQVTKPGYAKNYKAKG